MSTQVTLTERAARRIGEILKAEPVGTMLRVLVEGGGCSGFQYKFDFDRDRANDDLVLAREGAPIPKTRFLSFLISRNRDIKSHFDWITRCLKS